MDATPTQSLTQSCAASGGFGARSGPQFLVWIRSLIRRAAGALSGGAYPAATLFTGSHLAALEAERLSRYRMLRVAGLRVSAMLKERHAEMFHGDAFDCPICALEQALLDVRNAETASAMACGGRRRR